jgi:long-chain acyl-CoA synthetase
MSDTDLVEGVPGPGRIGRVAAGDILHRTARRLPQRVAVVEGERQTTYGVLEAMVNRFAHYLLARGLEKGAKVASVCNNSTEFIAVIFGILKAGMVWVPVNTVLGVKDARYIAEHSGASLVVMDDDLHAIAERREIFTELGIDVIAKPSAAIPQRRSRRPGVAWQGRVRRRNEIHERELALIMRTSGHVASEGGDALPSRDHVSLPLQHDPVAA